MPDDAKMTASFDVGGIVNSMRRMTREWRKSVDAQQRDSKRVVTAWGKLGSSFRRVGAKLIASAQQIGLGIGYGIARGITRSIAAVVGLVRRALSSVLSFTIRWARRIAMVVGGLGAAFIANAVRVRSGVEATLAAVKGVTGSALDELRRTLTDIGGMENVVFSLGKVADAMYSLGSLGVSSAKAMKDMMAAALPMAAGMRTEIDPAIQLVLATLRTFGLESAEATRLADVMVKAQNTSAATFDRLAESMVYASPAFAAANQSIETMVAVLTRFYNAGIPASMAGASLQTIIARLIQPPKEAAKTIKQLGLSLADVDPVANDLIDVLLRLKDAGITQAQTLAMFGIRQGMRAYTLIQKVTPELKKYRDGLNESGAAAKLAAQQLDNLRGDVRKLGREFGLLNFVVGGLFQRGLRALVQGVTAFVKHMKEAVAVSTQLRSIAETLNDVLGRLGKWFSEINVGRAIRKGIGGIEAVGTWLIEAYRKLQGLYYLFVDFFKGNKLGSNLKSAFMLAGEVLLGYAKMCGQVLWEVLQAAFASVKTLLEQIVVPVAKKAVGALGVAVVDLIKSLPMWAQAMLGPIGLLGTKAGESVRTRAAGLAETRIPDWEQLDLTWKAITEAALPHLAEAGDHLAKFFSDTELEVRRFVFRVSPRAFDLLYDWRKGLDPLWLGLQKMLYHRVKALGDAVKDGSKAGIDEAKEGVKEGVKTALGAIGAEVAKQSKTMTTAKGGVISAAESYLRSRRRLREIGGELQAGGLSRAQRAELQFEANIERTKLNIARQEGRAAMAVVRAMQQAQRVRAQQVALLARIAANTARTAQAAVPRERAGAAGGIAFGGGGVGPGMAGDYAERARQVGQAAQRRYMAGQGPMRSREEVMAQAMRRLSETPTQAWHRQQREDLPLKGSGSEEAITAMREAQQGGGTVAAMAMLLSVVRSFAGSVVADQNQLKQRIEELTGVVEGALVRRREQSAAGAL